MANPLEEVSPVAISEPNPTIWLAQTKLRPPPLRPDVIARPRLLDSLRCALLSSRLTLVSAPAGYGKTTLLGALPRAVPELPLAWLSLDEEDGDPARFLTALVLALRHPFPDFGLTTLSLLSGPPMPGLEPRHIASALANDLLERAAGGCLLVLDDLHLLSEPGVYLALDYLLQRMPPQIHVAVATRHDPPLSLARLRARGHLAELRLADVRFTLEEAEELLNHRLRLGLRQSEIERLYSLTEGWPVGIRLLAGSLERIGVSDERSHFIAGLAQKDRHLLDYLAAEVLDHQDTAIHDFLLETSILSELTAERCLAVTGRENAAALLEEVDRRGLFVVPTGVGGTPRYHALFAEFLQGRLKREWPHRVMELHRRAAEADPVPSRALSHYLAAKCWDQAAALVESLGPGMLVDGLARTVANWIQALPPEGGGDRPMLTLLHGLSLLSLGEIAAARASLERALQALEGGPGSATAGLAESCLATCRMLQGDFSGAAEIVERALGHPTLPAYRAQLLLTRCWLAMFQGDSDRAAADLAEALDHVEQDGLPEAFMGMAIQLKPDLIALPGGLQQLERFIRLASPFVGDRITPLGVALQELEACVHILRGRLVQGIEGCVQVLANVDRLGGYQYLGPSVAGLAAQIEASRGNHDAAGRLLAFVQSSFAAIPVGEAFDALVLYGLGKTRLLKGDKDGARRALQEIRSAEGVRPSPASAVARLKLEGLVAMAERRFAAAERALREVAALEEQVPLGRLIGLSRVLLARLAYERNRPEEALAELEPVLVECQREDTPGLILIDGKEAAPVLRLAARRGFYGFFADRVLSALEPEAPRASAMVPETGEVLSPRELEILGLIASGAANRAIAEKLIIGEATVKSHVTSLLRKLNASSRTQAAARARELGVSV